MSSPKGETVVCANCAAEFETPAPHTPAETLICPSCGRPAAAKAGSPAGDALPGPRKKSVDLDLSGILVRESNPKSRPVRDSKPSAPPLQHPEKLASTADDAYAPVEAPPVERGMSARGRRKIVGWDEGDGESEDGASTASTRFFIASGVLVVAAAVLALIARPKNQPQDPIPGPVVGEVDGDAPPLGQTDTEGAVKNLRDRIGSAQLLAMATGAVKGFLEAPDAATRLSFCRDPERVRPLMADYYSRHDPGPVPYKEISQSQTLTDFLFVEVDLGGSEKRPVVLSRDGEKDRLLVDWEAFVAYGEMDFDRLGSERPVTPTLMRLVVELDDYYNFGFTDSEHLCTRLTAAYAEGHLYGYAPLDSDVAKKLHALLKGSPGSAKYLVLRIRFPDPPKSRNQVIIEEIVAKGWVIE